MIDRLESNREEWQLYAACRGSDPNLFFPDGISGKNILIEVAAAKQVCAICVVRNECLNFALAGEEQFGVWGGTSEIERRAMIRQQNQTKNPPKSA